MGRAIEQKINERKEIKKEGRSCKEGSKLGLEGNECIKMKGSCSTAERRLNDSWLCLCVTKQTPSRGEECSTVVMSFYNQASYSAVRIPATFSVLTSATSRTVSVYKTQMATRLTNM
jgi:hypothetical protein